VTTLSDIAKSDFEEMETLYKMGGVDLINKVLGLELEDFRYGMPYPNVNPGFKSVEKLAEEYRPIPKTPVENLVSYLELQNESSYEEYEDSLQRKFGFSKLLGDEDFWNSEDGGSLLLKEVHINVPLGQLKNEKYMEMVKSCYELNLNLPGCLGTLLCIVVSYGT
jgi:hypothetical protein